MNRKSAHGGEPAFQQRHDFAAPQLLPLLELSDEEFRERFRGSPIKRAKRVGLQRNVCVALGNIGDTAAVPALVRSLRSPDTIVREHAAWALGRIGGATAARALTSALNAEEDGTVRREIELSLDGAAAGAA